MKISRRELSALLPVLAAAQTPPPAAGRKMLESKTFLYEELPVKLNGKNKGRAVLEGETHSGYPIGVHMTELAPGQMPHPPHHHPHEEVMMLRRGVLEATYGGQTRHVTTGSLIYMASNVEHSWKNPGPEPAEYFVIELGKGQA